MPRGGRAARPFAPQRVALDRRVGTKVNDADHPSNNRPEPREVKYPGCPRHPKKKAKAGAGRGPSSRAASTAAAFSTAAVPCSTAAASSTAAAGAPSSSTVATAQQTSLAGAAGFSEAFPAALRNRPTAKLAKAAAARAPVVPSGAPSRAATMTEYSGGGSPSGRYEKIEKNLLGEGTYGEVFKVRDNVTGEILAMKKMKLHDEDEGIPSTAIREISVLKELPHRNVVQLRDVFCTKQKVGIFRTENF